MDAKGSFNAETVQRAFFDHPLGAPGLGISRKRIDVGSPLFCALEDEGDRAGNLSRFSAMTVADAISMMVWASPAHSRCR